MTNCKFGLSGGANALDSLIYACDTRQVGTSALEQPAIKEAVNIGETWCYELIAKFKYASIVACILSAIAFAYSNDLVTSNGNKTWMSLCCSCIKDVFRAKNVICHLCHVDSNLLPFDTPNYYLFIKRADKCLNLFTRTIGRNGPIDGD